MRKKHLCKYIYYKMNTHLNATKKTTEKQNKIDEKKKTECL